MFERFYRSASARALPGSGLGLAIVKHVVVKHGGALRIEDSTPGGNPPGTMIHVVLPGSPTSTGEHANGKKSVDVPNEISVDSQSTVAR